MELTLDQALQKGIEDQSIDIFNERPIIFKDIYEMAKLRKKGL